MILMPIMASFEAGIANYGRGANGCSSMGWPEDCYDEEPERPDVIGPMISAAVVGAGIFSLSYLPSKPKITRFALGGVPRSEPRLSISVQPSAEGALLGVSGRF
jgi:hypothetical protein